MNACPVKHAAILDDISRYYETLDPEECEELVQRILSFNEGCDPAVGILDCG